MSENKTNKIRIIAFSDSHGDNEALWRLVPIINTADYCFFLGDGYNSVMTQKFRIKAELYAVPGNCDAGASEKGVKVVEIGQCKFMLCHGHQFNVKSSLLALRLTAQSAGCDYAVFGHTHTPLIENDGNVTLINPGSLFCRYGMNGSYAVIEGDGISFSCEIKCNTVAK